MSFLHPNQYIAPYHPNIGLGLDTLTHSSGLV